MRRAFDTNVLIYAFDRNSPFCKWARETIAEAVAGNGAAINAVSLATLLKSVRNARNCVEININQRLGREMIPPRHDMFHIETTGACNLMCRFCAYFKKQAPKEAEKLGIK